MASGTSHFALKIPSTRKEINVAHRHGKDLFQALVAVKSGLNSGWKGFLCGPGKMCDSFYHQQVIP